MLKTIKDFPSYKDKEDKEVGIKEGEQIGIEKGIEKGRLETAKN